MKKIVTGALALLLITGAAQAQQTEKGKGHRRQPAAHLNLTAEQQSRLKTIREDHRKAWQELQQQDNITVKEWKARREALKQKQQSEIKAVLTPEQQQQLAKTHQRHGKGMKAARGGHAREVAQQLNLTETQKQKMKAAHEGFRSKRQALRTNTALTDAQKKEQMKALAQQHRQEVKSVLTTEQQQKLESLRQERRNKTGK